MVLHTCKMYKINLREGEELVKIYRQTEFVLLKAVFIIFLSIYVPVGILLKYELLERFSRLVFIWTLLVALYGIYKFLLWLLNCYILTDRRILCVKYFTLLHKQITETPLAKIANIGFHSKGLLSLTNVGNVELHVAGVHEPVELKNLRHPDKIKDEIWQTLQTFKQPVG